MIKKHKVEVITFLFMLLLYFRPTSIPLTAACSLERSQPEEIPDDTTPGNPKKPFYTSGIKLEENYHETYNTFHRNIHQRSLLIAVSKDFQLSSSIEEKLANHMFLSWSRSWAEFQGYPWKAYPYSGSAADYTGVVKKVQSYDAMGKAYATGFSVNFKDKTYLCAFAQSTIAHEIFHAWNGVTIDEYSGEEKWFTEGITDYYAARLSLYQNQMGISRAAYLYLVKYMPEKNIPLVDMGKTDTGPYYDKGTLVGWLLDKELYNKGYDLGYLMRYLYLNYGLNHIKISNDIILQSLYAITGEDFTPFFNDYIYGTTPLPLPEKDFDYIPHYFLELSTNQDVYKAGDTFSLELDFANPELAFQTDIFVGIIVPDGSTYFFDKAMNLVEGDISNSRTYTPLVENVKILAGQTYLDVPLFSVALPEIPEGEYTLFAFLAEPGTTTQAGSPKIIGRVSQKTVTVGR